ncbi:MAG: hypothetical protein EP343_23040 [Deltaproteobacteria bacterium]|nr:MAG: hypothetical protein EP343_23040 [Deltaproteobacteria bacterium]
MRRLLDEILFTLKVSRPGFYPTTLWFFLLPFGQRNMFGSWVFWLGCVYVCLPLGLMLYGWNDLMDMQTDSHNPRKDSYLFGARLEPHHRSKVIWQMVLIQLPFWPLFVWLAGPKMLLLLVAMVATNAVYNAPGWGWKNRPWLDLLNQAGYLLVFVLSSWLNHVPQLPASVMVFSALFAMHSHLFGQLMDIDADTQAGRRTTASVIGVVPGKLLLVTILVVEALIVGPRDTIVAAFLGLSALIFLVDAFLVFRERPYPSWAIKVFFVGWNIVAIASMNWLWTRGTLVGN